MPEMKTALEVMREIANRHHGKTGNNSTGLCPDDFGMPMWTHSCEDCELCHNTNFRAHVAGYAEKYPEGE